MAVWVFDRALRLCRLAYFNLYPSAVGVKATATFDSTTGLVRLDVSSAYRLQNAPPGSFFFVYEPYCVQGYESHPFTPLQLPFDRSISAQIVQRRQTALFDELLHIFRPVHVRIIGKVEP